jgi:hypothetical protein
MNELRKKRLLILATDAAWHQRFYSGYYRLVQEGLVNWVMGTAFLTDAGRKELKRLLNKQEIDA